MYNEMEESHIIIIVNIVVIITNLKRGKNQNRTAALNKQHFANSILGQQLFVNKHTPAAQAPIRTIHQKSQTLAIQSSAVGACSQATFGTSFF